MMYEDSLITQIIKIIQNITKVEKFVKALTKIKKKALMKELYLLVTCW